MLILDLYRHGQIFRWSNQLCCRSISCTPTLLKPSSSISNGHNLSASAVVPTSSSAIVLLVFLPHLHLLPLIQLHSSRPRLAGPPQEAWTWVRLPLSSPPFTPMSRSQFLLRQLLNFVLLRVYLFFCCFCYISLSNLWCYIFRDQFLLELSGSIYFSWVCFWIELFPSLTFFQ